MLLSMCVYSSLFFRTSVFPVLSFYGLIPFHALSISLTRSVISFLPLYLSLPTSPSLSFPLSLSPYLPLSLPLSLSPYLFLCLPLSLSPNLSLSLYLYLSLFQPLSLFICLPIYRHSFATFLPLRIFFTPL